MHAIYRTTLRFGAVAVAIPLLSLPLDTFGSGPAGQAAEESSFLADNDAAMTKMMNSMAIEATGDVDRDFVAMMAPHHQGAIEMAEAELRYGHDEHLRRIAQEIVIEQQQEIVAMRLALTQRSPPLPLPPDLASAPSDEPMLKTPLSSLVKQLDTDSTTEPQ